MANNKSGIIKIASMTAILLVLTFYVYNWTYLFQDGEIKYQPILLNLFVLIPGILGLKKFENRIISKWTSVGFILYGILTILFYSILLTSTNTIDVGSSMKFILIPYALIFSIYLFISLIRKV